MNLPLVAYHVGSVALLLYGVGHTFGYLQGRREDAGKLYVRVLKESPAILPGITRTQFHLYEGYSWMTSLMTGAFGAMNLVLALSAPEVAAASRPLQAVGLVVALACATLAKRYFFAAPLGLSLLASAAFAVAVVTAA